MTIKESREYFLTLYQKLSYLGDLKGSKFSFTISKNKEVLAPMLKKVQEMAKRPEGFAEYDSKRTEINKKYALKDEKGEFILIEKKGVKNYDIDPSKTEVYEKELSDLKIEYKEVLDTIENQKVLLDEYVNEEVEIKLRALPLSIVPNDITIDQMDILSKLIEE